MHIADAIRQRRAVRQFDPRPVPPAVIETILDLGRRAQSSKNTQPWQFILIQDRDTLKRLSTMGDFAAHLAGATFAVLLVGMQKGHWNAFDLGQAATYLQLAAWEQGVGSCIAAIYTPDDAKALLGIPAEYTAWCALSFGYPAADHQPARLGGRKPLDEVVRREKW